MNKTLLAFRGMTTGANMLAQNTIINSAKEQIDMITEYNLEKAKKNMDTRLQAMQTTFLFEIRDANNRYVEQTTDLTAQANDARTQSLTSMASAGTKITNSSFTQDVQNQIDDEYLTTVNTLGMAFDENYKRMEMMNQEQIKQALNRGMEQSLKIQQQAYEQKESLATQQKVSNIKNMGKLGSLGILAYDKFGRTTSGNTGSGSQYNYDLDLDIFK